MHERSGPQFLTTTTATPSGPDAFEKWKFLMIFLIILGVTKIWYSITSVLEGKTDKVVPDSLRSEILETFLANNFALSNAEDKNSGTLGNIQQIYLENTVSNSPKVPAAKFLGSLAASRAFL